MGASYYGGNLYAMLRTTGRCNGGNGITRYDMIPIFFQGDSWQTGPQVPFDHHCRHCPYGRPIVFQCKSGRVWTFFNMGGLRPIAEGYAGYGEYCFAKHSDDGGITWRYPGAYPHQVVRVAGEETAVPYKDQVAVFGKDSIFGDRNFHWQFFDGEKFQEGTPALPLAFADRRKILVQSAAGTPQGTLMAALLPRGGKRDNLTTANLIGGQWKLEQLDDGSAGEIGPVALTASGEKVFCFWVRKETKEGTDTYPLLYALWEPKGGWGKPLEVTREAEAIHRIVTPVVSPPDYAPVFWDKWTPFKNEWKKNYPWVRFARVPSDKPWKPGTPQPAGK